MTTFTVTSEQFDTLLAGGRVVIGADEEPRCDCSEHRPGMHVNTAKCPNIGGTLSPGARVTASEAEQDCLPPYPDDPMRRLHCRCYSKRSCCLCNKRPPCSVSAVLEAVVPWEKVAYCPTPHVAWAQKPWVTSSGVLHLDPEPFDEFASDPPAFVVVLAASRTEEAEG